MGLSKRLRLGMRDKTLFQKNYLRKDLLILPCSLKKFNFDIPIIQIYEDYISFGSTNNSLCGDFFQYDKLRVQNEFYE